MVDGLGMRKEGRGLYVIDRLYGLIAVGEAISLPKSEVLLFLEVLQSKSYGGMSFL